MLLEFPLIIQMGAFSWFSLHYLQHLNKFSLKSQGRILTIFGVTTAICSAPFVAIINLIAIAVWPTWIAVAVCETLRKVCFIYPLDGEK